MPYQAERIAEAANQLDAQAGSRLQTLRLCGIGFVHVAALALLTFFALGAA